MKRFLVTILAFALAIGWSSTIYAGTVTINGEVQTAIEVEHENQVTSDSDKTLNKDYFYPLFKSTFLLLPKYTDGGLSAFLPVNVNVDHTGNANISYAGMWYLQYKGDSFNWGLAGFDVRGEMAFVDAGDPLGLIMAGGIQPNDDVVAKLGTSVSGWDVNAYAGVENDPLKKRFGTVRVTKRVAPRTTVGLTMAGKRWDTQQTYSEGANVLKYAATEGNLGVDVSRMMRYGTWTAAAAASVANHDKGQEMRAESHYLKDAAFTLGLNQMTLADFTVDANFYHVGDNFFAPFATDVSPVNKGTFTGKNRFFVDAHRDLRLLRGLLTADVKATYGFDIDHRASDLHTDLTLGSSYGKDLGIFDYQVALQKMASYSLGHGFSLGEWTAYGEVGIVPSDAFSLKAYALSRDGKKPIFYTESRYRTSFGPTAKLGFKTCDGKNNFYAGLSQEVGRATVQLQYGEDTIFTDNGSGKPWSWMGAGDGYDQVTRPDYFKLSVTLPF